MHAAPKAVGVMLGAFLVGVAVWGVWLGWDTDYYWDETVGAYQGPYRQMQVVGCALTYALVTAFMSLWWPPLRVTLGVAGGFWTAWTLQAATTDETGLFMVGALLLCPPLLLGAAVASGCGYASRSLLRRLTSRRQPP